MSENKIAMKAKMEDTVTGFVGHVTAYLVYMMGCIQYQVEKADGIELKAYWIDEERLEVVKPRVAKKTSKPRKALVRFGSGGPARGPSAY